MRFNQFAILGVLTVGALDIGRQDVKGDKVQHLPGDKYSTLIG
jgi:hypothetical protein